jgi:hypothetical protein
MPVQNQTPLSPLKFHNEAAEGAAFDVVAIDLRRRRIAFTKEPSSCSMAVPLPGFGALGKKTVPLLVFAAKFDGDDFKNPG